VANDLPSAKPSDNGADNGAANGTSSGLGSNTLGSVSARPADDAKRITIQTPLVTGSLTTKGARIDDVTLTAYQETLEEGSNDITLLRKISDSQPYFAEFGWIGDNVDASLPNDETIWTASSDILSPNNEVTLRYDNGEGLIFNRILAIDDQYMITVTDEVTSARDETLRLLPYGLIRRFGTPETTGIYILHEGPIGVVDTTLKEQSYGDLRDEVIEFETEEEGGWVKIAIKLIIWVLPWCLIKVRRFLTKHAFSLALKS